MDYFESNTEFRANASDVSKLPHRQLAAKVFGQVLRGYTLDWDKPVRLRPDVSPEMLEACFARIFGKTAQEHVVNRLPETAAAYAGWDPDDLWLILVAQRPLLAKTAEMAGWGSPSTQDHERIIMLAFSILENEEQVNRFVEQAKRRLALH